MTTNIKYLDPKADLTFKKIFAGHPDLLISLLNALLPLKRNQQIKSIEYLPTELVPVDPLHKDTIVDVRMWRADNLLSRCRWHGQMHSSSECCSMPQRHM